MHGNQQRHYSRYKLRSSSSPRLWRKKQVAGNKLDPGIDGVAEEPVAAVVAIVVAVGGVKAFVGARVVPVGFGVEGVAESFLHRPVIALLDKGVVCVPPDRHCLQKY